MTLKAIILGIDGVLAEIQEARREAFNTVFGEADLEWRWGRTIYGELLKSSQGDDLIATFVNSHLPQWRQTEDLLKLIGALKRRHATVLQELIESGSVKLQARAPSDSSKPQTARTCKWPSPRMRHGAKLRRLLKTSLRAAPEIDARLHARRSSLRRRVAAARSCPGNARTRSPRLRCG